jgi:hypothetical protein
MSKVESIQLPYAMRIQKRWGTRNVYGWANFGNCIYGNGRSDFGIYQIRKCTDGRKSVHMIWYKPFNAQSEIQQANRQKFETAREAWAPLTSPEKRDYNLKAMGKHFSGYNLFVREYMRSH